MKSPVQYDYPWRQSGCQLCLQPCVTLTFDFLFHSLSTWITFVIISHQNRFIHSFAKYRVHNYGNRRTDGHVEKRHAVWPDGGVKQLQIHCVSKNAPTFASCSFDNHWLILIIFGKQDQHNFSKNLAIANRSRVSCAHNTSRAFIGLNITPWHWNLDSASLKITGNGTIGQIIHELLVVELFEVKYYRDLEMWSLKIIESGTIWKLGYGFLFAFHSNYGRICSHFGDIQHQRMAWPWNLGLGFFKVIEKGAVP